MQNSQFYTCVSDSQKVKVKERKKVKWKQILSIAGLFVFVAPLIPGRRRVHDFPNDFPEYLERAGIAALIVSAIGIVVFWSRIKPVFGEANSYKYQGVFVVSNKVLKPKKRLQLHPGTDHFVSVSSAFFNSIAVGDKVHVERRLSGEILLLKKLL